ncbi:MAG TPA: phosphoenolpyruvate--protein phosphotransferase [Roseimicrobium sp.]|nr:phosphoenolpyruvate--protein phosphotransferase [Roseimicrobium sp.]
MPEQARPGEKVYRGIAVSPGISRGKVLILGQSELAVPKHAIQESEVVGQNRRLEQALTLTRQQILDVQRQVRDAMGAEHASIFDAHLLLLEDHTLIDEVTRIIRDKLVNVEQAFEEVSTRYIATLSAIDDEYLRERATDLRDVASRIQNNLLGRSEDVDPARITEPCIIVSYDLTPSVTARLDKKVVLGFCTDIGSKTSHTAIMARSLQIPAVVGLRDISQRLENDQQILLDGYNGVIVVNPTDQTLFEYGQLVRKQVNLEANLRELKDKPAITLDGEQITLSANLEQPSDAEAVKACGAEGVGLFRTEYLFINREKLPTEEEQFEAYAAVAKALKPAPVVIRTLDLGGDKFLSHLHVPQEMNPFLGWRAIRFCLQEREIFGNQLRAILRASCFGNVKMMYPMISGLDELNQANALLEECKAGLRSKGIPFDESMEVGAMIEIPSAALIADALAKRVKFFSIGTNDLIQYTLAVDRMNEKIAHLYEPTHPAILRLIKNTVDAAHRHGIWVGVCGEMAGEPSLVPLLLGLGVDELSAASPLVPQIKFLIRRSKRQEMKELAEWALGCDSAPEILNRSTAMAQRLAPSLFASKT